jgi:uncharacterized protein (DUF1810 family)
VPDVTTPSDRFDLQRFVTAHARGDIYDRALDELRRGRKQSHWMWYVFPQIAGLGTSTMAQRYAISSLAEAQAYVTHPVLGPRLIECARMLIDLGGQDPVQVVGAVDSLKLRSSMTLFERAAPSEPVFAEVLERYFGGRRDQATLDRL